MIYFNPITNDNKWEGIFWKFNFQLLHWNMLRTYIFFQIKCLKGTTSIVQSVEGYLLVLLQNKKKTEKRTF